MDIKGINKSNLLYIHLISTFFTVLLFVSVVLFFQTTRGVEKKYREQQTKQLSSVLTNEYERIIKTSKLILSEWADDIRESGKYTNPCLSPIINVLENDEKYINYGFGDLKGNVVCSKIKFPEGDNLAVRVPEYNKVIEEGKFKVTDFGYSGSTGEARLAVGYPLESDEKGSLGVLFISMRLLSLNKEIENFEHPDNAQLLITDDSGTVMISYPREAAKLGERNFDAKLFSIILSQKEGTLEIKGTDGIERIYVFSPYTMDDNNEVINFIMYGLPRELPMINRIDMILLGQIVLLSLIIIAQGYAIHKIVRIKE